LYLGAKFDKTSAVRTKPKAHEHNDSLCDHFLGKAKENAGGLGESCACEADRVLEFGWYAIEE
jgi:hypothetical protein